MSEPITYWEERCELLESSVQQIVRILLVNLPPQIQRDLGDHFHAWQTYIDKLDAKHAPTPTDSGERP